MFNDERCVLSCSNVGENELENYSHSSYKHHDKDGSDGQAQDADDGELWHSRRSSQEERDADNPDPQED